MQCQIFSRSGHPRKFTPSSDQAMLRKNTLKRGGAAKSQTLRVLVTMINVQSYDSAIRKTLNKYGLLGSVVRRKPHLLKKNMTAQLTFL